MSESEIASSFFPVTSGNKQTKEVLDSRRNDAFLVNRIEEGADDAFDDFYRRFAPLVNGIVISRVPYSDAEDVVQEVFVAAFKSLNRLRDKNAVGPWMARIARNCTVEYFRRKRPTEELKNDHTQRPVPTSDALEALEAISSLPDTYRETLSLRLIEGMTGPEIALMTGKTEASVRVNLHRGMKMLRRKLRVGMEQMK